jgi:hypothetical protein
VGIRKENLYPQIPGVTPPSAGGCDGHLQGLPSIRSLFHYYFSAKNFISFIGLPYVADDDFFALSLSAVLGRIDRFALEVDHVHSKGLRVYLHFLKFQSSFVNGRLNLSTEYITIISGMRK